MVVNNWFETTIGEQATLQRGIDITRAEQRPGRVPVVSSGGISSYHDTVQIKAPGVVLGRKGVVGSVYYIPEDYWPHDTTLWVKDFHGNHPRFIYYFFKSIASLIARMDVGSANPTLNRNHVHPIKVLWPPIAEQKTIAHILGTLDDKIELNQQMNQTLEAIARALFKSWFIDFDPVRAKLDGRQPAGMDAETAALFPAEFEDGGAIGKIPKGWKIQDLSDLAKILSGKRPSERSPEPTAEMPIPLFGGGGVMAYVKDPLYREPILLTGRVGTLGLVFRIAKPCWTSDNTLIILPKQTFNYEFLYFQLREIRFESLNRGSTQPLVTQGDLTKQQFVVSDALLLQAFHQITSLLYKRFEINSDETESLTSIRDALLPKLLSGEIRVQDAETVVERVV